MKEIFKRFSSESPKFFKRLQALMISLGGAGVSIMAAPMIYPAIIMPEALSTLATHLITIGVIGTAISKLTVADPAVLKPEDKSNDVTPPSTPK